MHNEATKIGYQHALYINPAFLRPEISPYNGVSQLHYVRQTAGFAVLPDGRVEVNLACDVKDASVTVDCEQCSLDMPATGDICRKALLKPLAPGIHACRFTVNGVPYINPLMNVGYSGFGLINYIDIPEPDGSDAVEDIPHGSVRLEYFASSVAQRYLCCLVYTPPSYDRCSARYPVLYLQHGGGENEQAWLWYGKINHICDRLIAAGDIAEAIVVLNCGYVFTRAADEDPAYGSVDDMLALDCVPMIDARFRTLADRHHRAVAGVSMGAFQANACAMKHADVFANIGVFSGVFSTLGHGYDRRALFMDAGAFRQTYDCFFIAYGRGEQPACDQWERVCRSYRQKGLPMLFEAFEGGHDWHVWRQAVQTFMKMLYRPSADGDAQSTERNIEV